MSEKKNILILEDNAMMRSLLKTLLELEDLNVICPVFPIPDPLKIIHESNPDVIILDINLPGINGLTLLGLVKESDKFRKIKVIISSGSDLKQESLAAGADSFLMKPFMPDELIHLIKAHLN
jgi:DNA-binding response OmpR family regulator